MTEPSLRQLDLQHVWHPYTRQSVLTQEDWPIITRGEGVYLYDDQGRRFFDAISSWWACNLGHSHPRIVDAIQKQTQSLQHSILGQMSHPAVVNLSARLARLFPSPDRHILYASDGASAVEAAMKVALQYWCNVGMPAKNRFLSLEDSYHGDTLGAVSIGYLEAFHRPFKPALFDSFRGESPHCAHCPYKQKPESCHLECFAVTEATLRANHDAIAAVVVEPLCQGAAGIRIYPARHLAKLAALCKELNILLIVDEIAMGYGRTGTMFAFEQAGIDPDIVCLGKSLSGGYLPMSATVVRDVIYNTFGDKPNDNTLYHGHTFGGNPIAAAAALATLDVYRDEGILEKAAAIGDYFTRQIPSFMATPQVHHASALGAILAVELTDAALARKVRNRLFDQGYLLRPLDGVVYLMPPLISDITLLSRTTEVLLSAIVTV